MAEITWEKDAEQALAKAPFFVRGLVRIKVAGQVMKNGGSVVTLKDFREAESAFRKIAAGKSRDELESMLPAENGPGVEMIILQACRSELSNCPNVLVKPGGWIQAIEKWISENELNEKLRRGIGEDKILFHHKINISVSGCPNGCSMPQIADIGLTGFVEPALAPEDCTECGECMRACPDRAIKADGTPPVFDRELCQGCTRCRDACAGGCISIERPAMRVLLGGRLGRRPHLAEHKYKVTNTDELIVILDKLISNYIGNAAPGDRMADFLIRTELK